MARTPEAVAGLLGKLHQSAAGVARSSANIRRSAEERRTVIDAKLADLRPATLTSADAAQEYSDLIEERGRLDQVLGVANA